MEEPQKIIREERIEEIANRDAFRLALVIGFLFALFLVVLLVAAWNSRFMVMSVPARPPETKAEKTFLRSAPGPHLSGWLVLSGHTSARAAGHGGARGANF